MALWYPREHTPKGKQQVRVSVFKPCPWWLLWGRRMNTRNMEKVFKEPKKEVLSITSTLENKAQLKSNSTAQERKQFEEAHKHRMPGVCIAMCLLLSSASSWDNTDSLDYSGMQSPIWTGHGLISSKELLSLFLISVVLKRVCPSACWAGSPLLSEQHFQGNGYGQLCLSAGSLKRHTAECFEMDIWHAVNAFRKQ